MTTKEKNRYGANRAASNTHCALNFTRISTWRLAYTLEEARQSHEAHRRHFRHLACRIGLAALRLGRLA